MPTAQCEQVSEEAILNLSAQLFDADTNNVFKYLEIDTRAGRGRRYFWMGANIFQGPQDGMGPQ